MNISIGGTGNLSAVSQNVQVSGLSKEKDEDAAGDLSTVQQYDSISTEGDTLQISQDGKMALSNFQTEEETEEDSSSSDLSSYSESELKEMYQNGEITKAEYDAEISKRQQENMTSSDTETTMAAETLQKMTQAAE